MMKYSLWAVLGLCALLGAPAALADSADQVRMQRAIDLRVDNGQFMGAVLVVRGNQVLLNRAYGMESLALKRPNQTDTRFRVGSVTKQMTAAAILLLEERGKLKLDDPIRRYLPDAPKEWNEITFRHLLSHTSGLPNLLNLSNDSAFTPRQLVDRMKERALDFRPGTSWNYSNSGYILLGYLIERISGQPYGRFVQQHFFRPLHMWNSGYEPNAGRLAHQAQGHVQGADGLTPARYIDMSASFSSGGIYSTTGDLLKWVQGLYSGKVLHAAALQKMITPASNHYGLGVVVDPLPNGDKAYSIGGGIDGFSAKVLYEPHSKLTLIVLSNVSAEAADVLLGDLQKVADGDPVTLKSDLVAMRLSEAALERLAGAYWTEEATILNLSRKGDHLLVQGAGANRDLYPHTSREFFARNENVEIDFADSPPGTEPSFDYHLPDRIIHAERIAPTDVRAIYDMRARKIQEQTATPGSAQALRDLILQIEAGKPDYSRLGPVAADFTRRELPRLRPLFERLGSIQHIDFLGVAPVTAADLYLVSFEHGPMQARINLGPDGRIWSQDVRSWQSSHSVQDIVDGETGRTAASPRAEHAGGP